MSDLLKIKEKLKNDCLSYTLLEKAESANEDYNGNMLRDMKIFKENFVKYVEKSPSLPILYGYFEEFRTMFFDTKEEFFDYYNNNNIIINYIFVIQYLNNFAGKDDVIRIIDISGVRYFAAFKANYHYYQCVETKNGKHSSWQCKIGDVSDMYRAFRNMGIVFKDDIYAQIEKETKELIKTLERCISKL